ncbi:flagellin [[Pantoea] beijingensis]|uniref:Flagellin n=1 Tax=[Pantoea] beijingensis TaxID=1324864 RepID=A0A443IIH2_9GAMM|nr:MULTISPECIES: FliC/FljB family flagellin [Erwiniaceae]RWR03898.1 flagellin [[Pantoea] beijingensis]
MAQVINTNSLSLMTQNNMNKSQSALGTAIERLSSSLRINSAKDDAAGQAIANRFTSNIKGLTQAARNANDGISVAQTTEGSLGEINNNLQRIRELTVQAQNGTNSDSDLSSIQDEITSRLAEIDRVSGQTQFNGVKVLASNNTMQIQVGANDGETIAIDLKKIDSGTLKLDKFNVVRPTTADLKDTNGVAVAAADVKNAGGDVVDLLQYKNAAGDVAYAVKDADTGKYMEATVAITDADPAADPAVNASAVVTVGAAEIDNAPTDDPLKALDDAIAQVDQFRSSLGAVQNRLDSAITNLNNTTTNLSSAQSRIQDADYATEVSNMSKAQILQQAGNSVLARANQVPQSVLSLLQG